MSFFKKAGKISPAASALFNIAFGLYMLGFWFLRVNCPAGGSCQLKTGPLFWLGLAGSIVILGVGLYSFIKLKQNRFVIAPNKTVGYFYFGMAALIATLLFASIIWNGMILITTIFWSVAVAIMAFLGYKLTRKG